MNIQTVTAMMVAAALLSGCSDGKSSRGDTGSQSNPSSTKVNFERDEAADRLTVVSATSEARWSNLLVKVTSCNQAAGSGAVGRVGNAGQPYYNEAASAGGGGINAASPTGTACGEPNLVQLGGSAGAPVVRVGDYLEFCSSPEAGDMSNVKVTLWDWTENADVFESTFADWADC